MENKVVNFVGKVNSGWLIIVTCITSLWFRGTSYLMLTFKDAFGRTYLQLIQAYLMT